MHGRQGQTARARVTDLDVAEAAFRRNPPQIDFEECSAMCRIYGVLKGRETLFDDKREQTEQTELVRRGDDDPAAGPYDPEQLAAERTRILEVLDCFH